MKKNILFVLFLYPFFSEAQQTSISTSPGKPDKSIVWCKIGETVIPVNIYQYGHARDVVLINLHSNETTSLGAASKLLEQQGGTLITIDNRQKRLITFKFHRTTYTFDPNRMFSTDGIAKTLVPKNKDARRTSYQIKKFATKILSLFPNDYKWIVALHNNTNEGFSINYYLPGGENQKDAASVYINENTDMDDFFLTTDSLLFKQLIIEKYNTVLQDNVNAADDGSLSVYCGKKDILYLNCETEHGKFVEYLNMITSAILYIRRSVEQTK